MAYSIWSAVDSDIYFCLTWSCCRRNHDELLWILPIYIFLRLCVFSPFISPVTWDVTDVIIYNQSVWTFKKLPCLHRCWCLPDRGECWTRVSSGVWLVTYCRSFFHSFALFLFINSVLTMNDMLLKSWLNSDFCYITYFLDGCLFSKALKTEEKNVVDVFFLHH